MTTSKRQVVFVFLQEGEGEEIDDDSGNGQQRGVEAVEHTAMTG